MVQEISRYWWVLVLRGLAAIAFGVVVILAPDLALTFLVTLWAVYTLVDGVLSIVSGIQGRVNNSHWWVMVLEGIVGILAGVFALMLPGLTALTLLYIIAAWAVVTGVLEIITAIRLRNEIEGEFWMGLSGLISIVFGVLLMLSPGAGILSLLWLLSIYAIAFGVMLIMLGFRLRGYQQSGPSSSGMYPTA